MQGIPHRYLTESLPGVGGTIKQELEDFQVFEVPLYSPSGDGEHTYFEIEKVDLPTLDAISRIAQQLKISKREIGHAGLKDRKSISRQTFSVRLVPPEEIQNLSIPNLKILWTKKHGNKLRIGHLKGNRFKIRIRNVSEEAYSRVESIIEILLREGVPNYYGPQRFGSRDDAHLLGENLLRRENDLVIKRLLGFPSRSERNPRVLKARLLFEEGDLQGAYDHFPFSYRLELKLLKYLLQAPGNYRGAVRKIDESIRKIYYSAFQSALFNKLVDRRLELSGGRPGLLFEGDLAQLHRNLAVFSVEDTQVEQVRSDAWEISPTGPLFGKMMTWPQGLQLELEEEVLRRQSMRPTLFHQLMPNLKMKGSRRALRFQIRDLKWHLEDRDLFLEFFLPKGSYATTFLREIMKNDEPGFCYYSRAQEDIENDQEKIEI